MVINPLIRLPPPRLKRLEKLEQIAYLIILRFELLNYFSKSLGGDRMDDILGMKPRNAFIGVCFAMMGVDEMIDQRELTKLFEVLDRYGFTEDEIMEEMNNFTSLNMKEGLRYGQKSMAAITGLDSDMREDLVQAMTEIAISDEYFHDAEKTLLTAVKMTLGMPV